jgi:hypothetical protein
MSKKNKKTISLSHVRALAMPEMSLAGENAPTPERLLKLPGVTIASAVGSRELVAVFPTKADKPVGADKVVRINQAPLDRLEARRQLDPADAERNRKLHESGDRLRQHWYRAGLSGIGSIDLNRSGGGGGSPAWLTPTSEDMAYHRHRFRKARDGMDADHWAAVSRVCCDEQDLAAVGRQAGFGNDAAASAVALDRLRRGLEHLAVLFGILPPRPANSNLPGFQAISA